MDKKEEEILSMHYQIEKTDIKQQKMEDRLLSISKELKKSKKISNLYFALIVALIILMVISSFYLLKNDVFSTSENALEIEKLQVVNDSLLNEVSKLKTDITQQSENVASVIDSSSIANDSLAGIPISKFKRQYCYVTKAYESNDVIFIEADFIEYHQGRNAVRKAKEFGEAEYDIDKNGDTIYYLYNNYYIHNQSTKAIILELDDKARVRMDNINQISNGFPLKAFQRSIKENPVLILETINGVVYRITEQKLL